jgi:hypothetical protein
MELPLRFRHSPNGFRYRSNEPYCVIALLPYFLDFSLLAVATNHPKRMNP